MKYLVAALAACAFAAQAQSVDAIVAECERQMALDVCRVAIDKSKYPPNATVLIAGVGRLPLDAYLKVRNADKQMCVLARAYCTKAPDGNECKTAKAFWGR